MRLDSDSKQPIWLGLILIFAAFIFTLFFITSVRANDEVSEPPYDPQYNNLVFMTVSDKLYIGGDTVIDMYSGASDGANAIAWKNNFSSNLSGFFQFVPKDQCFFIIASDGANAGFLNSIRDVLSDLGASYWSGEQDGFWNPDHDLSGYEDQRAPFGIYNVRYMSRIVKYLPVVSPSPTPEPERSSLVFHASSNMYFLIDFFGANVGNTSVSVPSNSVLQSLQSEFNSIDDVAVNSAFLTHSGSGGTYVSYINLWFNADSIDDVKIYFLGSAPVDLDYVRDTVSPQSFSIQTVADGYDDTLNRHYQTFNSSWSGYLAKDGTTLKRFCIALRYYYNSSLSWGVDSVLGSLSTNFFSLALDASFRGDRPFSWTYGSTQYVFGLRYQINFTEHSYPFVTPTPEPTATPEPLPTSSESIHVILPTGTPTPTPPFSVPAEDLGGGSGSPGGSSHGSLTPGQVNSTLNTFKQYTQNNGAFAFLYACTGLIPDDALFFLFILLFILLLLACLRLFVHFTGG